MSTDLYWIFFLNVGRYAINLKLNSQNKYTSDINDIFIKKREGLFWEGHGEIVEN